MQIEKITYPGYDGEMRTKEFFFNLEPQEIVHMELGDGGGLSARLQNMLNGRDIPGLAKELDAIIDASYGIISSDGESFIKTPDALMKFKCSKAYNTLYMDLMKDDKRAAAFIRGLMPEVDDEALAKAQAQAGIVPVV